MEKRILGVALIILGIAGLIYAGVQFINGGTGAKHIKIILFAAVLGGIFFSAGIGLVKRTSDKPS